MLRGWDKGVLLGAAIVAGEVLHARFRRVPWFDGFDPSGRLGDPGDPPMRLLILGDSSATGQGLEDHNESWPRLVAEWLADGYRVELTSLAEGGSRSQDVLDRQVPAAEESHWDLAVVSVGSNDMLHLVAPWRFARNLDEIVGRLNEVCDQVVLFGVGDLGTIPRLPFPLNRLVSASGRLADLIHLRASRRHGVSKVNQWELTTESFRSGPHMFSTDLFHPSSFGHRAWADAVIATIAPLVGDAGSGRAHRHIRARRSSPASS